MRNARMKVALVAALMSLTALAAAAQAANFSAWGTAQKIDEIARQQLRAEHAVPGRLSDSVSGRAQPLHGFEPARTDRVCLDIWVARRESTDDPWGAPENLGAPVNSAADDFCPTPVRGGGLFFVSREALPGSCGMGDIYFTRYNPTHGLDGAAQPRLRSGRAEHRARRAGPVVRGERRRRAFLYFSSSSAAVPGDIYVSHAALGLELRRIRRPWPA